MKHKPYNKLKVWLKDNNIKYSDIAKILGRSETSVMHKINGYSDFLLSEIQLLKTHYNLNNEIFFTE